MEEIKVGEYVRTKRGSIGKFKFYGIDDADEKIVYFKNHNGTTCVEQNEITKHSPNIIDLIEPGDYVNGFRVSDLSDGLHLEFDYGVSFVDVGLSTYTDGHIEGIKTILTKEQYTANCYEVK